MTNIWANTFDEIRKPYFEMEDPYTKLQEEEKAGEKYEGKYKKTGKKSKDYDGDGEVEDEADEYAGVKDRAIKKAMKKEETLYTSKASQEKIDVRKGLKNKITISPQVREEVDAWVGELVEEGYDLSEFTWDEIAKIYLDEAGTSTMAPKGDYQTDVATATQKKDPNAPLIAAKAKAAQARIRSDIADAQLAKTSSKYESVIHYLAQRPDAFENLEEGVFDPKKSKLRPASERTGSSMTAAQRTAAKKEQERVSQIHSKGETVLAGLRPSKKGKVNTTPKEKSPAPEANRKVKGKYDALAQKASKILKGI